MKDKTLREKNLPFYKKMCLPKCVTLKLAQSRLWEVTQANLVKAPIFWLRTKKSGIKELERTQEVLEKEL